MKIRLTQSGFETYTGQMGVIFFENGLSTNDVLPVDAVRLAAVFGAEWEDGTPANVSQIYLDNMHTEAKTDAEQREHDGSTVAETEETTADVAEEEPAAQEAADVSGVTYTREQLSQIADKDGIAGLRAIAEPMGIKDKSISGLIDAILKTAPTFKAE